jgi:tetratricopeptide (TPR) repeat protein
VVDSSQHSQYTLRTAVARAYVALGKMEAAQQLIETLNPHPTNTAELWIYAWLQGETRPVAELARLRTVPHLFSSLLGRSGRLQDAEALFRREKPSMPPPPPVSAAMAKAAQGEMELARRRVSEATTLLEEAMGELRRWGAKSDFFLAAEALAARWESAGETERALQILARASQERPRLYYYRDGMTAAAFWMRVEIKRIELLRRLGRAQEARAAAADLQNLLAHADSDYFAVRRLKETESTLSSEFSPSE